MTTPVVVEIDHSIATLTIAREERRRDLDARVEELLAIGRRCAESLQPGPAAVEHGDLLYGDDGLPK